MVESGSLQFQLNFISATSYLQIITQGVQAPDCHWSGVRLVLVCLLIHLFMLFKSQILCCSFGMLTNWFKVVAVGHSEGSGRTSTPLMPARLISVLASFVCVPLSHKTLIWKSVRLSDKGWTAAKTRRGRTDGGKGQRQWSTESCR